MASASKVEDAEMHWTDFLSRLGRIYNKLAAATKGNPKSAPWFGIQCNFRSADPLLLYLHQARHCHEHSIEAVVEAEPGSATFASDNGGEVQNLRADLDGLRGRIRLIPGTSGRVSGHLPRLILVPVTNRGVTYDPPAQYGSPSGYQLPVKAADAALAIADSMLSDARKYLAC